MYLENYVKIFILMIGFCTYGFSQNVEMTISPKSQKTTELKCYQISLTSPMQDHRLGGQNYRLYYNGDDAMFVESSLKTKLKGAYKLQLKEHIHDVDASQYGNLIFDRHLSFINFYIDFDSQDADEAIVINDAHFVVADFCFDAEDAVDMSFAHRGITDGYATAFNEITSVLENGKLQSLDISFPASVDNNIDIENNAVNFSKVFPNPFEDTFALQLALSSVADVHTIEIYNIYGSLIKQIDYNQSDVNMIIDMSDQIAGAYIIKVLDKNQTFLETIKVTKMK